MTKKPVKCDATGVMDQGCERVREEVGYRNAPAYKSKLAGHFWYDQEQPSSGE